MIPQNGTLISGNLHIAVWDTVWGWFQGLGFGGWGLKFRAWGLALRSFGLGFRVWVRGLESRGLGRVQGSRFRVSYLVSPFRHPMYTFAKNS